MELPKQLVLRVPQPQQQQQQPQQQQQQQQVTSNNSNTLRTKQVIDGKLPKSLSIQTERERERSNNVFDGLFENSHSSLSVVAQPLIMLSHAPNDTMQSKTHSKPSITTTRTTIPTW